MLLLRVDVERPYVTYRKGMYPNLPTRILYYAVNLLTATFEEPRFEFVGYLRHLYDFTDYLNEKGVRATFFLRSNAMPSDQQVFRGHQVGIHCWTSRTLDDFKKELGRVQKVVGRYRINGMSKHGSGRMKESWRHARAYEPSKYLEWCNALGLRYFAGNSEDPKISAKRIGIVTYYPSAFWLERHRRPKGIDLTWLIRESQQRDIVVLVHPEDWLLDRESQRDDLEVILSNGRFGLF